MGDEDRGAVLEVFFYELHDFFAGQIVETFKRLVEQDGVTACQHGADDGNAPCHAAGELHGVLFEVLGVEPDLQKRFFCGRFRAPGGDGNVFGGGEVRQQPVFLKHGARLLKAMDFAGIRRQKI